MPKKAFFRRNLAPVVRTTAIVVGVLFSASLLSLAEKFSLPPETSGFRSGPGSDIAVAQCLLCHSADYVSTQPRLGRVAWKTIVLKMRDKYGAPLADDKLEPLLDYLTKTYGAETTK